MTSSPLSPPAALRQDRVARGRANLLELGDEEPVDVVQMRVVPAGEFEARVERLAHEAGEALLAERETRLKQVSA